jgi:hypothetical protein
MPNSFLPCFRFRQFLWLLLLRIVLNKEADVKRSNLFLLLQGSWESTLSLIKLKIDDIRFV